MYKFGKKLKTKFMKTRFILCAFVIFFMFSCKDNKETEDTKTAVIENKTTITLANLSDENWQKGVGTKYKMFLTDFSKENEELLKNGKTLLLADGKTVPYLGYQVAGSYIQIFLNEDAIKYSSSAEFPNEITVK